jgi:cellulose synthase/poly-beta-1,6-N-acetylglucosamine synthase-like glycosyltransferase
VNSLDIALIIVASVSIIILWWTFDGYLRVLRLLPERQQQELGEGYRPGSVTVLITAWNEEAVIERRVHNALSIALPDVDLLVMVASDGSTDQTDEIVESIPDPRVVLYRTGDNVGKTAAQNAALQHVDSDIVIFTDAEASFESGFLSAILSPFADPTVGLVDASVVFYQQRTAIGAGQSRYWRHEQKLRLAESELGILPTASGQGMAVRRRLIQHMREDVGDDCLLPLQVIRQGFYVIHSKNAIVTDRMPESTQGELQARARMTARNWVGTWSHAILLNPLCYPGIALSLWSHKILRWCSPIFVLLLLASTIALGGLGGPWCWIWIGPGLVLGIWCVGGILSAVGCRLPIVSTCWAFLIANIGFAKGLLLVVGGIRIRTYRNI